MDSYSPEEIPILCFHYILAFVSFSTATNETKLKDLKTFYYMIDNKKKNYHFKEAIERVKKQIINNETVLPKWLIDFEDFVEEDSSGT